MEFDFDRLIHRRNTHSAKWDRMAAACGVEEADAIPMWVADMDFAAPPAVTAALRAEVERATHGYYNANRSWREAQCDWLERRHGWRPDPDWLSTTPGIVSGLGLILQALTEPGDEVIVFSPVYHAFRIIIEANGRVIHNVPMIEEQGRYRMDLDRLARAFPARGRIVFFCSPHNPGGRVWRREEIRSLADLCRERDLILVSDEIHCDLVYAGSTHLPTATVAPDIVDRLITCVAATKTFNLAGAHVGALITANADMRKKIDARIMAAGLASYNLFGMIATEAALRGGDKWLDALLPYLAANRDRFADGIARAIPGARAMELEATYLAWVDFAGTGLERNDFMHRITQQARIGVSPGPAFGPGGEQRVRFNFATQRHWLDAALDRLAEAFADLV